MTISIARPNSSNADTVSGSCRVDPADVWDVQRGRVAHCSASRVRTLDANYRKDELLLGRQQTVPVAREQTVETRGANRAAAAMGALFGIALLIGSAFGGAFSGEEKSYAPDGFQNAVASVNAR